MLALLFSIPAVQRTPPAIIRLQRATRELSASFLYAGLVRNIEPLDLFHESSHQDWWFGEAHNVTDVLAEASLTNERTFSTAGPLPSRPREAHRSALLEARAQRAEQTARVLPGLKQLQDPAPDGAEPVGPAEAAEDRRDVANRGLCLKQLQSVAARRTKLEAAIVDLVDPRVLPRLPAIDSAILLLFMAEMHTGRARLVLESNCIECPVVVLTAEMRTGRAQRRTCDQAPCS